MRTTYLYIARGLLLLNCCTFCYSSEEESEKSSLTSQSEESLEILEEIETISEGEPETAPEGSGESRHRKEKTEDFSCAQQWLDKHCPSYISLLRELGDDDCCDEENEHYIIEKTERTDINELNLTKRITDLKSYIGKNYRMKSILETPTSIRIEKNKMFCTYEKGTTLQDVIEYYIANPTSTQIYNAVVTVFTKLGETLAYMHEYGGLDALLLSRLIHRQLSPTNIMYHPGFFTSISFTEIESIAVDQYSSVLFDLGAVLSNCLEILDGPEAKECRNIFLNAFFDAYKDTLSITFNQRKFLTMFFNDFLTESSLMALNKCLSKETIHNRKKSGSIQHNVCDLYIECIRLCIEHKTTNLIQVLETLKIQKVIEHAAHSAPSQMSS